MSVTDTHDPEPVLVALSEDLDGGFVELFGAYRRLLFSVPVRVCGQWAEAEDLTAETFLRAYRALREYPPEQILALQPRAWLVTILLNVWRNQTRAAARRPTTVDLAGVTEPVDPRADVVAAIEQRETGWQLAGQLAQLPSGSGSRWCCGTSMTCRSPRSPTCWVARRGP